jgi:hypothetical protein
MCDVVNYSDDVVIPEDDNGFDSLGEASFVETICQQEDYDILDSSSMLQNFDYESINSVGLDLCNSDYNTSLIDESIPNVLDFIQSQLPDGWLENVQNIYGADLTDDEIIQSVQQASEFFNMNAPMEIWEGWTTGVINGMTFTENDDILIFNRAQLQDMGITDKEGFDLVMTHEGAHRALQGMDLGFSEHQEELCCDYMAGIRAGLNGMDEGKIASSLANTEECTSHPDGAMRVQAIEQGVAFAHEYMEEHYGTPPSFSECLEHFEQSDLCIHAFIDTPEQINLRPEDVSLDSPHEFYKGEFGNATGDYWDDSHPSDRAINAFVNDRSYHLHEAQTAKENAEWHHKRANEAVARGDLLQARDHESRAAIYERSYRDHLDSAAKCSKFVGESTEKDSTAKELSFGSGQYTKEEIDSMRSEVERTEYAMKCRKDDVSNWESKVSILDNPDAHRNGDYAHAVDRLNEAKSRYNTAAEAYDRAKSRLNNAL